VPSIIWIGLDVHKNSTTAAILEDDAAEAQVLRLGADLNQLCKLFRKLSKRGSIRACYEASGCGFVVHRVLEKDGFACEVIAPSLIPSRAGDRKKTDRRDAINLAKLYRGGLLTPVHVPDEEQEAVRDLVRTHVFRTKQITSTKLRIHGLLLRQGHVYRDSSYWTKKHRTWLAQLRRKLTGPAATILNADLELLEYLETQLKAIDEQIETISTQPPYRETVGVLTCLRGVRTFSAMTMATEVGDIRRFSSAPKFMGWTGLVPGERSSGDRQHRGPITKTGNVFLRRVLIEAAHNHRSRAGSTLILDRRRSGKPPEVVSIAIKAQHRLSKRYWKLAAHKHSNVAVTAVARELAGFVWAIMTATASIA
jgi:transposase